MGCKSKNANQQFPESDAIDLFRRRYGDLILDLELPACDKEALIGVIWNIMRTFVDLGFEFNNTEPCSHDGNASGNELTTVIFDYLFKSDCNLVSVKLGKTDNSSRKSHGDDKNVGK